jgi:hypothetical protein
MNYVDTLVKFGDVSHFPHVLVQVAVVNLTLKTLNLHTTIHLIIHPLMENFN